MVAETVAEYIQFLEGTPGALSRAIGLRVPGAVQPGTRVRVLGGGTIVFDEFGRANATTARTSAIPGASIAG